MWPSRKPTSLPSRRTSQESLVDLKAAALGDITVQKEVRVDVTRLNENNAVQHARGTHDAVIAAGDGAITPTTYVDELYSLCYAPGIRLRPDSTLRTSRHSNKS
jgi:hypothetical protein